MQTITAQWKRMEPQCQPDYFFLDKAIDNQYRSDTNFERLFFYFGVLAIFISCLGLLGLALFSTYTRTKEIGIRKVMGAGVFDIVRLLMTGFLTLVLIAFAIATPIAWLAMNDWLEKFAYRISIGWPTFLAAGLAAILVAGMTIGFQTIKAAMANPVDSLRAE